MSPDAEAAFEAIERWTVLFVQDRRLPSLATLIAGEPVRGSWWGHPASGRIFHAYGELEHHPDVARVKLLDAKVCLVHRALFGALVAIGRAREPWQLEGLDAEARALLDRVDAGEPVRAAGKPVKALEQRLLVVSDQVHTASGRHVTELSTWARFAEQRGARAARSVAKAKASIEAATEALAAAHGRTARLPWR